MANKNYGHIAAIVVLVLVFFGLLILSTSNSNVSVNYDLIDTIEINSYEDLNTIELGTVNIKNDGLISSRVDLKKYVICQLSDYYGDRNYEIQYRGARTVQGKVELFSYDYYQKRIDVSSGEEIELLMTVSPYSISERTIDEYQLYNATLPFYLFEMGANDNAWNFCNTARIEDAFKVINLDINLSKNPQRDIPTKLID